MAELLELTGRLWPQTSKRTHRLGRAWWAGLNDVVQWGRRYEEVADIEAGTPLAAESDERLLGFDVVILEYQFASAPSDAMGHVPVDGDALGRVAEIFVPRQPAHAASICTTRAHDGGSGGLGPKRPTTTVADLGAAAGHGV